MKNTVRNIEDHDAETKSDDEGHTFYVNQTSCKGNDVDRPMVCVNMCECAYAIVC